MQTRHISTFTDFDSNTKILLTSRIMHRFQRFLMFWKAECLLFHLETTFPHCFVFVRSKTWHLWKVCLIYWTNAGSSIPDLGKLWKWILHISTKSQYLKYSICEKYATPLDCVLSNYERNPSSLAMLCSIHINPLSEPGGWGWTLLLLEVQELVLDEPAHTGWLSHCCIA